MSPARSARGSAITGDRRWELAARLLNDNTIDPVDRAAGCLVLLYGQPASRIAALTISQITSHGDDEDVTIRLGQHDIPVPAPLGKLLLTLAAEGKPTAAPERPGTRNGCSRDSWPGGRSRPTPGRTAPRQRCPGHGRAPHRTHRPGRPGPRRRARRQPRVPPATAVRWRHQAGADWNRYAAELAGNAITNPGNSLPVARPGRGIQCGSNIALYQFRCLRRPAGCPDRCSTRLSRGRRCVTRGPRKNLDRHPNYILAAYMASGTGTCRRTL